MGHFMHCLHVHTCFHNSLFLHADAEDCALAVFTLSNLEFLPIFVIQDTMFIVCSHSCLCSEQSECNLRDSLYCASFRCSIQL
jgi:hypothetical protein